MAHSRNPPPCPPRRNPMRRVAAATDVINRLRRITDAHTPDIHNGLLTWRCPECEKPWPCPTYRMTYTKDAAAADDEPTDLT